MYSSILLHCFLFKCYCSFKLRSILNFRSFVFSRCVFFFQFWVREYWVKSKIIRNWPEIKTKSPCGWKPNEDGKKEGQRKTESGVKTQRKLSYTPWVLNLKKKKKNTKRPCARTYFKVGKIIPTVSIREEQGKNTLFYIKI